MPVLAVGAAAEVAQHVLDNWLYLGLIQSFYLATFYSGVALGQSDGSTIAISRWARLQSVAQHMLDNWLYLGLIPSFYLAAFCSGVALGQSDGFTIAIRKDEELSCEFCCLRRSLLIRLRIRGRA
jgi:hypothetical protein